MWPLLVIGATAAGLWYLVEGRHPSAFISFAAEDANIRDLLVGQAKHPQASWKIRDRSLHSPFSNAWKSQTREIISGSDVVVVLIGKHTHSAEGVLWEVATAVSEGIPVFGVHISKDRKGRVPKVLEGKPVIVWSQKGLARQIAASARRKKA